MLLLKGGGLGLDAKEGPAAFFSDEMSSCSLPATLEHFSIFGPVYRVKKQRIPFNLMFLVYVYLNLDFVFGLFVCFLAWKQQGPSQFWVAA